MREVAVTARAMFNAFLAEGFTGTEALALVRSWIHSTAGGSHT